MSRAISIVSVDDEKITSDKDLEEPQDDEIEKLMQRIQRQRNVLDEILGHELKVESVKVEPKPADIDVIEKVQTETKIEEPEAENEVAETKDKVPEAQKEVAKAQEEVPEDQDEEEVSEAQDEVKVPEVQEVKEKIKEPEKKLVEEVEKEEVDQPEGSHTNFLEYLYQLSKTGMKMIFITDSQYYITHQKNILFSLSKLSKLLIPFTKLFYFFKH